MDLEKLVKRLIDEGLLTDEDDIRLFRILAEDAPELLALVYAAALADEKIRDPKDSLH